MSKLLRRRFGLVTVFRITEYLVFLLLFGTACLSNAVFAQWPAPNSGPASRRGAGDIHIYVMGPDGGPIDVPAVVSLVAPTGQVLRQGSQAKACTQNLDCSCFGFEKARLKAETSRRTPKQI